MIEKKGLRIKEIERSISDITDSIEIVESNLPENFDEFRNFGLKKDGIYKKIEFAIQNIIDICNVINSDLRLGVPDVEDDIFDNLEKKGIFEKKIMDILREMKGSRNILVHKYGTINDKIAFEDIKQGLEDFELIIQEVEKFLEKHKNNEKQKNSNKDWRKKSNGEKEIKENKKNTFG